MTSMVTVRNIPEEDKEWLRRKAEETGRSMEATIRDIIAEKRRDDLSRREDEPLADFVRRLFGPENGFDFEVPKLSGSLRVPDFSGPEFDVPEET